MGRKTIYISGAITHDPDYKSHFRKAEQDIYENVSRGEWDFTGFINPARVNCELPSDFEWADYMECCYKYLDLCQGIYMLKGWQNSEGAKRELAYAKLMNIEIYYEDGEEDGTGQ